MLEKLVNRTQEFKIAEEFLSMIKEKFKKIDEELTKIGKLRLFGQEKRIVEEHV